jgi:hypothetical protein
MRLRAEEEKRAAAGGGDAAGSASAGPGASVDPGGSASACAVVTSIPSAAHVSIDADVEPVSAISSAHESEAEVEQCLDHAQEQQQSSGMLEHMDEDDPHVDDTRAPTELLPSSSRSRPSERDHEHGSPDANVSLLILPRIIVSPLLVPSKRMLTHFISFCFAGAVEAML